MKYDLENVVKNFQIDDVFVYAKPYGCGHINDTFDVKFQNSRYILQRINNSIFKNVPALMNNIKLVTEFQRARILEKGGNPDRECLTLIKTVDGNSFYFDGENYFRMYIFIEGATTYQVVESPKDFYNAAKAFGNFQKLLSAFDAGQIYEVIPNFHNTKSRFADFVKAVKEDKMGRAKDVQAEIKFAMDRESITSKIVEMLESKEMPLKVTHNDTKLNNVMIDDETGDGICVIDLDTIMPGSSVYDFGDSIRFGTNPVSEDEKDLSKVVMSMPLFEEYAKGFLGAVGDGLTKAEADNLAFGSILMTYECGIRFLSDHLNGDTYFKIHRENHNLDRARTQFKLVSDMEKNLEDMNAIVAKYYKG